MVSCQKFVGLVLDVISIEVIVSTVTFDRFKVSHALRLSYFGFLSRQKIENLSGESAMVRSSARKSSGLKAGNPLEWISKARLI